jgi:glutamyl-tRNA reductase
VRILPSPVQMVGWSHRTTPLAVLERMTVRRGEELALLAALTLAGYAEAVVLSTCSRTEVYAVAGRAPVADLAQVVAEYAECPAQWSPPAERRSGLDAAEHLFRVAGGLESRVIGEVEILAQVRQALRSATRAGTAGATLRRMFLAAIRAGGEVREQTTLGARGRSLACQAVERGLAAASAVADPVVVVVGTGRMASTAVEHLARVHRRPQVAARDEVSAARLAGPTGVCPLPALTDALQAADLVICATSAAQWVVTGAQVRAAMGRRQARPLTVVDLSVPRNVELAVGEVDGVSLVDLESLNDDWTNDAELRTALTTGAEVVAAALARYADELAIAGAGPLIAALRREVEATCLRELTRSLGSAALGEPELARAAHAVAGKLLHRPTMAARSAAAEGDESLLRRLCDALGVTAPVAAGA